MKAASSPCGKQVSRAALKTTGKPMSIRLTAEMDSMKADGCSLRSVHAVLIDDNYSKGQFTAWQGLDRFRRP